MAQDNRISLPSSGGGLMRYSEETGSRIKMSPMTVMVIIAVIIVIAIAINVF
ncbi:MAG TPA: preprotein translocase subunit Sec61beta [Candidatus Nanoarchaeia archaeon]|nr:preprotein translocase subunit Sec61beta [Candidatus Nanoarchaeia archaeon]